MREPFVVEQLRVVIIGGSKTAAQLIVDFMSRAFVDLVCVVDLSPDSHGGQAAQRFAVPFTTDIHELRLLDPQPDLIIDVCGKPHVNPALEATFPSAEEGGPVVVHDIVARMILSLAADSATLIPSCWLPGEIADSL
jgi:hypothetical protein